MKPVVLILTHRDDVHAVAVEDHLANAGVEVHRCDTAHLGTPACPVIAHVHDGMITGQLAGCDLSRVTCVWHRRPSELPGSADDIAELRAGVGGVLAALPYLNHPVDMAAALKPRQLVVAAKCGLCVPDTLVSTQRAASVAFADTHGGNVVVKPMSRRVSGLVRDGDRTGWARAIHLTQQRITKTADIRVTVVDWSLFAVRIRSPYLDWREDLAACEYEGAKVPEDVSAAVFRTMTHLRLRFGIFDFAEDVDGRWWFLEVNPNGMWLWLEDEIGQPISQAVASALVRC